MSRIREYFERSSSFFRGMASLGLFGADNYQRPFWMNNKLTPEQQDYLAIKKDWEQVGNDLEKSVNSFKKK